MWFNALLDQVLRGDDVGVEVPRCLLVEAIVCHVVDLVGEVGPVV